MRPFRMPAVALTILAWAVFAGSASAAPSSGGGDGPVITFSRAAALYGPQRVWYVVSGERALAGVDDEAPADDESSTADEDSAVGDEWLDGYTLPSSLPESEYELMGILQSAGLVSGGTYRSALKQLELPFIFAGREQWVRNVTGEGVEDDPRLWDVSMQSVVSDPNAQRLLLGRTLASTEARGPQAAFDDLSYWETLVPKWAPKVRDTLAEQGIPFSVELLSSSEVNLTDPSKPLFDKGEAPQSLLPLGVLQAGENAFLRSLSAEELMLEVWPSYWRYAHRPAGAPVPDDLRAGMTFGSPVLLSDGTYLRSPMMTTNAYKRWQVYGYPGDTVDKDAPSIADWNPTGYTQLWLLSDELEGYAPWNLDEATLSRYDLLLHGK